MTQQNRLDLQIYVDQPAAGSSQCSNISDPTNVGHSFLSIEQGGDTRTLGFYPRGTANPLAPNDPMQLKDNAGKGSDISVSFEINAQELDYLLDYIKNGTPNNYDLNSFNCTNWVAEACSRMGVNLPQNQSNWPRGHGLCPGQFGEDMRNFTLQDRQVTTNQSSSAPLNRFTCNQSTQKTLL